MWSDLSSDLRPGSYTLKDVTGFLLGTRKLENCLDRLNCVGRCCQSAAAVLGERGQEPAVRVRRRQVERGRLVSVGRRSDVDGQLLGQRTEAGQGLVLQQAALRQRHSQVQEMGRKVGLRAAVA